MTREQDLERQLAEWLSDGPVAAPKVVVDKAIERTATRRQRHRAWRWFGLPAELPGRRSTLRRLAGVTTMAAVLAAVLMTVALRPAPAPQMDPSVVRVVAGSAELAHEVADDGLLRRELSLEVGDPRVDGSALQVLLVEEAAGLARSAGTMRLTNDWGAWEGTITGARYPDGSALEYGWLTGEDAYEGFSYFYSTHSPSAGAEPVVEGAIWPGEPPPMPDPSLLP